MATGGKGRADREVRDRNRAYLARKEFHDGQVHRRTRDDVIAGVAGGILILAILGGQILYFTTGPGAPHPSPSSTPSPAPSAS